MKFLRRLYARICHRITGEMPTLYEGYMYGMGFTPPNFLIRFRPGCPFVKNNVPVSLNHQVIHLSYYDQNGLGDFSYVMTLKDEQDRLIKIRTGKKEIGDIGIEFVPFYDIFIRPGFAQPIESIES